MNELSAPARATLTADARAPRIGHVEVVFPENRYSQAELVDALEKRWSDHPKIRALVQKLHGSVAVEERHLALPLEEHANLEDFGQTNDAFIRIGTELGAKAVARAVAQSGLKLDEVDAIFFTTVTGIAAPSIDARLVNRLGLRRDIRRTPMFGLGCLGGAAGLARASDYLRGHPDHVAVLLSVELCTLTFQRDFSVANVVATGLFADGAAAVVLQGADQMPRSSIGPASILVEPHALRARPARIRGRVRPRVVDTRSAFFPNTERAMGWDVGPTGFKVVLSADVPTIVREHIPREVDGFLAEHGLTRRDVRHWVCHPGGPKVITAIEESLDLPSDALALTRQSLASVGNLSSASVLHVLGKTQERAMPGDIGVMMAMGPGFCAEMLFSPGSSMPLLIYEGLLVLVVCERLVELVLSKRHADAILARGGVEHGKGHYPWMVTLHTAFLAGCVLEPSLLDRPFIPMIGIPMLALALVAQGIRWWAITTLGVHWNTRVLVLPGAPRVTGGPYRFLRHPNYVAVVLEGIALALVHSAWLTAGIFTLLNAWLLTVRIRTEDAALATMESAR